MSFVGRWCQLCGDGVSCGAMVSVVGHWCQLWGDGVNCGAMVFVSVFSKNYIFCIFSYQSVSVKCGGGKVLEFYPDVKRTGPIAGALYVWTGPIAGALYAWTGRIAGALYV